jgi:uncharacterized membrane protein YdjX (TVP38/TMEM64 family)
MSELTHGVMEWMGNFGATGFLAMFILSSFVLVPRPLLCTLAGYILGFWAIPVALAGTLLGSGLALLSARYLLRAPVGRMLAKRPWIGATMQAMHMEGFRLIALLRLCSPVPGCLLNYFVGLTRISLLTFMTASLIGLTPQIILFVHLGVAGQMAASTTGTPMVLQFILNVAGLAVLALGVVVIRRRAKMVLNDSRAPRQRG